MNYSKYKSIKIFEIKEYQNLLKEKHDYRFYLKELNIKENIAYKRNLQIINGRLLELTGKIFLMQYEI
jgi:hypothetical protein